MDDTTLSEIILKDCCSKMTTILSDVVKLSNSNLMNINWNKTKEMLIGTNAANVISKCSVCQRLCD